MPELKNLVSDISDEKFRFLFVTDTLGILIMVFVAEEPFQLSLIFVNKACRCSTLNRISRLSPSTYGQMRYGVFH